MAKYTVKGGDSWYRIAGNELGNQRYFEALMAANPGKDYLVPGMVINLPDVDQNKPSSQIRVSEAGVAESIRRDIMAASTGSKGVLPSYNPADLTQGTARLLEQKGITQGAITAAQQGIYDPTQQYGNVYGVTTPTQYGGDTATGGGAGATSIGGGVVSQNAVTATPNMPQAIPGAYGAAGISMDEGGLQNVSLNTGYQPPSTGYVPTSMSNIERLVGQAQGIQAQTQGVFGTVNPQVGLNYDDAIKEIQNRYMTSNIGINPRAGQSFEGLVQNVAERRLLEQQIMDIGAQGAQQPQQQAVSQPDYSFLANAGYIRSDQLTGALDISQALPARAAAEWTVATQYLESTGTYPSVITTDAAAHLFSDADMRNMGYTMRGKEWVKVGAVGFAEAGQDGVTSPYLGDTGAVTGQTSSMWSPYSLYSGEIVPDRGGNYGGSQGGSYYGNYNYPTYYTGGGGAPRPNYFTPWGNVSANLYWRTPGWSG